MAASNTNKINLVSWSQIKKHVQAGHPNQYPLAPAGITPQVFAESNGLNADGTFMCPSGSSKVPMVCSTPGDVTMSDYTRAATWNSYRGEWKKVDAVVDGQPTHLRMTYDDYAADLELATSEGGYPGLKKGTYHKANVHRPRPRIVPDAEGVPVEIMVQSLPVLLMTRMGWSFLSGGTAFYTCEINIEDFKNPDKAPGAFLLWMCAFSKAFIWKITELPPRALYDKDFRITYKDGRVSTGLFVGSGPNGLPTPEDAAEVASISIRDFWGKGQFDEYQGAVSYQTPHFTHKILQPDGTYRMVNPCLLDIIQAHVKAVATQKAQEQGITDLADIGALYNELTLEDEIWVKGVGFFVITKLNGKRAFTDRKLAMYNDMGPARMTFTEIFHAPRPAMSSSTINPTQTAKSIARDDDEI